VFYFQCCIDSLSLGSFCFDSHSCIESLHIDSLHFHSQSCIDSLCFIFIIALHGKYLDENSVLANPWHSF
jgi:hypothetical protein